MQSHFERQLESAILTYETTIENCRFDDGSDMGPERCKQLMTGCLAAIERAVGRDSIHYEQTQVSQYPSHQFSDLARAVGVCRSLLEDIKNGYLQSLSEVIHSDMFADYLEMAEHLNNQGYKDAAAVIAGSTLEAHLKAICFKHGIPTTSGTKPLKADGLNAELAKRKAYSKIDQKNITAWLGLRNNAAHGEYSAYDESQVSLLISSIRDFVSRTPA
ncbi:hypothetical protein [Rhodopirellula bahusiensis]|uniref:hypothetical protein n=1 Tax=Rhodopirellula bahusiensis TaxID=2014065 RepID=UPI0032648513